MRERGKTTVGRCLTVIALVFSATIILFSPRPRADALESAWESDWPQIKRNITERQCGEAALLLLKHAQLGNRKAFVQLVGAIHVGALKMPGLPTDLLYITRLTTALTVHGYGAYPAADNDLFDVTPAKILALFEPLCAKKPDRDMDKCIAAVIRRKIVPSKEELLAEVKAYIGSAGAADFVCLANRK